MYSHQPGAGAYQAVTGPTSTAARRPGSPTGRRTLAVQLISTMPNETKAIHGSSHIWKAGRIAMKAIERPAKVPSIAARGGSLRIDGQAKAPASRRRPPMNAQTRPAAHDRHRA